VVDPIARRLSRARHIYATGCGKSSLAARLLAEDLSTLAVPADFLDPSNALHGGIGRVGRRDGIVFFSDSGQTDELRQIAHASGPAYKVLVTSAPAPDHWPADTVRITYAPLATRSDYGLPEAPFVQLRIARRLATSIARARHTPWDVTARTHPANHCSARREPEHLCR